MTDIDLFIKESWEYLRHNKIEVLCHLFVLSVKGRINNDTGLRNGSDLYLDVVGLL